MRVNSLRISLSILVLCFCFVLFPCLQSFSNQNKGAVSELVAENLDYGAFMLHEAIFKREKDLIKHLLTNHIDPNVVFEMFPSDGTEREKHAPLAQSFGGFTPLLAAVVYEDAELVKLIIDLGADVDMPAEAEDDSGAVLRPVALASILNSIPVLDVLKEAGADFSLKDNEGRSLAFYALVVGSGYHEECTEKLEEYLAQFGISRKDTDKNGMSVEDMLSEMGFSQGGQFDEQCEKTSCAGVLRVINGMLAIFEIDKPQAARELTEVELGEGALLVEMGYLRSDTVAPTQECKYIIAPSSYLKAKCVKHGM